MFRCESESTLFGLPNENTTGNKWLSYIYNTVPEQYNANIRYTIQQGRGKVFYVGGAVGVVNFCV